MDCTAVIVWATLMTMLKLSQSCLLVIYLNFHASTPSFTDVGIATIRLVRSLQRAAVAQDRISGSCITARSALIKKTRKAMCSQLLVTVTYPKL
ncbi:hypothetical protein R3P38DRAFT_225670 [Favolaschia claudopus]|uniref:Secreted protein n=1 Tax=Favolaschia claudopus TaxID=2862362 RepID=A0AAV9ZT92_9AGAR